MWGWVVGWGGEGVVDDVWVVCGGKVWYGCVDWIEVVFARVDRAK